MNYRELTIDVAIRIGTLYLPRETNKICDAMIAAIVERLCYGEEVRLKGLGIIKVEQHPARAGRNPQTGAPIQIAARRRAKFTAAKALQEALNPVRLTGAKRTA